MLRKIKCINRTPILLFKGYFLELIVAFINPALSNVIIGLDVLIMTLELLIKMSEFTNITTQR